DAHRLFSVLLEHVHQRRGWTGSVARTFAMSDVIGGQAESYGLRSRLLPVGFKHVCEVALSEEMLIGGEEAGGVGFGRHLPERDGLLGCLLLAEAVAMTGLPLRELVDRLQSRFGRRVYGRRD